ncbi:hypothetical protein [Levilactobacillus andaensis]|uniref:hypothetical protein n=1 Tax=Levilactobacillus andaensis TaxID=2799570 RepID=UPI0019431E39|nr:hypothetical protein [Levilactobacillus andaensis]
MTENAKDVTPEKTAVATKDAKKEPEWQGKFEDVTNHQRAFTITESDGTEIKVPMNWPGRTVAENLDATQYEYFQDGTLRDTPGTYHESMLSLFGTPLVGGKVHEPLDMKFFENEANQSDRNKTFNFLMDNGESFLTGMLN